MFSRTTMASSMRTPMARDRPSSDMGLRGKPKAQTATNDASTDTGSASPVMTVDRHELRNRNTTATVSAAPSMSPFSTPPTATAAVLHHAQRDARWKRGLNLRHTRADGFGHGRGAEPGGLEDVDADGF